MADRFADGKLRPATTVHLTAAVFATTASGEPGRLSSHARRSRAPQAKGRRVSLGLARVVCAVRVRGGTPSHDVRVRITPRARVKLGLRAARHGSKEGLKTR